MSDKPEISAVPAETGNTFPLNSLDNLPSRLDRLLPGSSNDKKSGDQSTPSSITFPPIGGDNGGANNRKPPVDRSRPPALSPTLVIPPLDARRPAPEQAKPIAGPQPPMIFPPLDAGRQRPGDQVKPVSAVVSDNQAKVADQPLKVGADGKIEISDKDFERIGPKAAKVLRDAGVEKITVTPGQGFDSYEATLKKPVSVDQDPAVDGCRKLKIDTTFKADVVKNPDGSFTLDNIQGLTAETKILFRWQDASVDKIKLTKTPDGKSEITSTGSWNGISRDNTRVKEGDIAGTAELLFGRMKDMTDAALKAAGRSR